MIIELWKLRVFVGDQIIDVAGAEETLRQAYDAWAIDGVGEGIIEVRGFWDAADRTEGDWKFKREDIKAMILFRV